jgi:VIT1/CCC1 family predicted Fe2+/Mn2+ transporter
MFHIYSSLLNPDIGYNILEVTEMESIEKSNIIQYSITALRKEIWVASIYALVARSYREKDPQLADRLNQLSIEEKTHAEFWTQFLEKRDQHIAITINPIRLVFFKVLYMIIGLGLTLKLLENTERELIAHYSHMLQSPHLTDQEKRVIIKLLEHELLHEEEFEEYVSCFDFFLKKVSTINSQFSNGLVAVLTIASGFAGLFVSPLDIVIPGLIVGFTGAVATMIGFYFFGRTQNMVRKSIIDRLKMTIAITPNIFVDRVRKYISEQKIGNDTAQAIIREAERNIEYLNNIITEEEYGFKPGSLSNPLPNAIYAGLLRLIGTLLPLIPYLLGFNLSISIPLSILFTILMLSINGFFVAVVAEIDIKRKVMELALTGFVLATIAFSVGRLAALLRSLV